MKQAILVVAFGSTVDSAREHQIDAVVNRIFLFNTVYNSINVIPLVNIKLMLL